MNLNEIKSKENERKKTTQSTSEEQRQKRKKKLQLNGSAKLACLPAATVIVQIQLLFTFAACYTLATCTRLYCCWAEPYEFTAICQCSTIYISIYHWSACVCVSTCTHTLRFFLCSSCSPLFFQFSPSAIIVPVSYSKCLEILGIFEVFNSHFPFICSHTWKKFAIFLSSGSLNRAPKPSYSMAWLLQ